MLTGSGQSPGRVVDPGRVKVRVGSLTRVGLKSGWVGSGRRRVRDDVIITS